MSGLNARAQSIGVPHVTIAAKMGTGQGSVEIDPTAQYARREVWMRLTERGGWMLPDIFGEAPTLA